VVARSGPRGVIEAGSYHKALLCAKAAYEKKADDIRVLNVSALTSLADYFILCSGGSHRQVQAVAEAIDKLMAEAGNHPQSVEGTSHANWILMDYTDVIVHVFQTDRREFYGLDQLWGDAKRVRFTGAQLNRLTIEPPVLPSHRRRSVSSSVRTSGARSSGHRSDGRHSGEHASARSADPRPPVRGEKS
jgi:ribosome-associated protein